MELVEGNLYWTIRDPVFRIKLNHLAPPTLPWQGRLLRRFTNVKYMVLVRLATDELESAEAVVNEHELFDNFDDAKVAFVKAAESHLALVEKYREEYQKFLADYQRTGEVSESFIFSFDPFFEER